MSNHVRSDDHLVNRPSLLLHSEVAEYFVALQDQVARWLPVIEVQGGRCIETRTLIGGVYFELIQKNSQMAEKRCFTALVS